MKKVFLLLFVSVLILFPTTLNADNLFGDWSGQLKVSPAISLKIVFHIEDGAVTLDSPDQNVYGIDCSVNYLSDDSISIAVPQLMMKYSGGLKDQTIVGQFIQGPAKLPLNLTSGVKKANRPQTPVGPFPYTTEPITVKAPDALLSGTLTLPENSTAATPLVVLVSGSGLQNRDEELFEHKPFAVIADFLARQGIASFRYDDRGYGESSGDASNATTADFANDAEAVVDYLRRTERFSKIGLLGHSEGGMIGYMLGAKPGVIDFLVSVAGPAVDGKVINAYQNKVALIASGIDLKTADEFSAALLKALTYRLQNGALKEVSDDFLAEIYPQSRNTPVGQQLSETITATLTKTDINPWMEYFLRFDPVDCLQKLQIPAFIIYGERDTQVPPALNLTPAQINAPNATVKVYPELNHMMQHSVTGHPGEYKEIEETFSKDVLNDIVIFINTID